VVLARGISFLFFLLSTPPSLTFFSRSQVAIVSVMAALAQLSLFTSFMVGDKCDLVNRLLKQ
jgi:hypothetical protein